MKLKEKCIYYNPIQEGYYLVFSVDKEMIYGRRGEYVNTSNLEAWINQNGPGVSFKIGDIIIGKDYIRNYYLDEKCLEQFELIKELTDKEFSIIETITYSDFPFPPAVVDVDKLTESTEIELLVRLIRNWKKEKVEIDKKIRTIEEALYKEYLKEFFPKLTAEGFFEKIWN